MNVTHCFQANNVTNCLSLTYPWETKPLQQKSRLISCKATSNDFRKQLSALNSKSANADQLKKAYRKLVLRYHPDVCDPSMKEESTRMFIEIQRTYMSLLNQESHIHVTSETKNKWECQLSELKRQSQLRQDQKHGSWGCRMRAKHHCP